MWFKVVLNKDGSVASCVEAAQSIDQGRTILFVEANNKEDALRAAKVRRSIYKLEYDRKLTSLGLCRDCRRPAVDGQTRCARCRDKKRHEDRQRSAGTFVPLTHEQRSELRSSRPKTSNERLVCLYECRNAFDRLGAKDFRKWLQSEIEKTFGADEEAQKAS